MFFNSVYDGLYYLNINDTVRYLTVFHSKESYEYFTQNGRILYSVGQGYKRTSGHPSGHQYFLKQILLNSKYQSDYPVFAEYLLTSIIQDSDSFREMLFLLINIITGNGDKEFLKTMSLQMDLFHLEAIVNKYCDPVTHAFDKQTYINEVYIHNADIFGFLTIYMNMFHMLEPVMSRELMEVWSTILNTFMYQETYAANPYDINKLVEMLLNLNTVAQCDGQHSIPIVLSENKSESKSVRRQLSEQPNTNNLNKRQRMST